MRVSLEKEKIRSLPSFVGVYAFTKKRKPLYVGKSVNVKVRLLSHLENARYDAKEALIIKNSDSVECIPTDSELKAILLEAELIKTHHPKYNVRWKDDRSFLYIKITKQETYPKIIPVRKENDKESLYFGPFSSLQNIHELLREIRKIFPFCTQKKMSKIPCFYAKIGLCSPCPNAIIAQSDSKKQQALIKAYRRNIRQVVRILCGDIEEVQKNLYKKLDRLRTAADYEAAIPVRNNIQRLENLIHWQLFDPHDIQTYAQSQQSLKVLHLLLSLYFTKLTKLERIECYDVSVHARKEATAAMAVLINGTIDKGEYRKFRIKSEKPKSDFEMIREVVKRRFQNPWKAPDLIVIDGGKPQVKTLLQVLRKLHQDIPVVGIAKRPDRLVIGIENFPTIRPRLTNLGFNLIRLLRDESHRFARKYHLQLRKRRMFSV
ncbi:GIY-YIG nuclease family protein [Candidatus Roizmanbacteria bacterium]|nr:GIY-YIG nuclease family protein [Candidatus Roizmanbacteria bacterium]